MKALEVATDEEHVVEISKVDLDKLFEKLQGLHGKIEKTYLLFAEELYKASVAVCNGEPSWVVWGYDSFGEFAHAELGIKQAKAYYLVKIFKELRVKLKVPKKVLEEVEWAKAKELAPLATAGIVTEENVDDWLKKAKKMTVPQLAEDARSAKEELTTGKGVKPETITRLTFALFDPQYKNVMNALSVAAGVAGSDKKGHQLDMMALEFLSAYDSKTPTHSAMKIYLKSIERLFGLRLIAIDKKDKVVHGKRHLHT